MAPSALTGLGGVSRGSKLSSNIYYRKDKSHENDESEAPNNSPSKPLRQNSASPKHDSTQVPVAVVSPDFERAMDMAKFANKGTSSADRKTRFMQMMLTWLHTDSLQDDIRVERVARLYKHHKRRMSAMPLVHWTKDLMDKDSKVKALDEIETVHKNRASMKDLQTLIPSKPTPSTTPRPLSASTSYRPSIWDTTALLAVRALLAFKSLSSPSSKNKRQAAAAAAAQEELDAEGAVGEHVHSAPARKAHVLARTSMDGFVGKAAQFRSVPNMASSPSASLSQLNLPGSAPSDPNALYLDSSWHSEVANGSHNKLKQEEEEAIEFKQWLTQCVFLLRLRIWLLVSDPDSSWWLFWWSTDSIATEDRRFHLDFVPKSPLAYLLSVFVLSVIVLSTLTFCMETMEESFGDHRSQRVFMQIEVFSVVVFTVEYISKLVSATEAWAFVKGPMNMVDLLAILPFYAELCASYFASSSGGGGVDMRVLRVLRLVRVFRVVKLGGKYGKLQVVTKAIHESLDMLIMMLFLLFLSIIIFSSLIYFTEKGQYDPMLDRYVRDGEWAKDAFGDDIESPFKSIPSSFWWCMVTLMTVGYGDVFPITPLGKVVAGCAMVVSVLIMALPISVIGTHFGNQWMEFKDRERYNEQRLAPNFVNVCRDFREHLLLLEELYKRYTEAEDPVVKPLMRLEERLKLKTNAHKSRRPSAVVHATPSMAEAAQARSHSEPSMEVGNVQGSTSQRRKPRLNKAVSTLLSMSPLSSKVRERELADNIQLAQLLSEKMEPLRQVRVLLKTLLSENVVQLLERTDRNYRVYEMNAVDAVSHAADLRELKDKYYRHRGVIFGKPELDPQEPESIIKTTRKMMKKVRTSVLFQPEPSAKSMEFASSTYSNSPGRERDGEHQPTAPASVYVAPGRASMDGRAGLGNIEVFDKERNTRHSGKLSQVVPLY